MNYIQTAIKRGVTFLMIYLIAVGFGLFSLSQLKIDLYPKLEFPVIAVISQYTGVGPFDIETVVTRPIEETISSVQNVKKVSSTSRQGLSLVLLEFDWGTDMNQAEIDVRNSLDFIKDYLPEDMNDPLTFAFDPSMQPILFLTLSSDIQGLAELRRIAEKNLEPRLERIPGVASAFTVGGMRREIEVLADPVKMRAHNITVQQITQALQMNNMQLPSGWIDNPNREYTVRTFGEYSSIEEMENTNVAVYAGKPIRIKDVATVVDGFMNQRQRVWTNNKPAVILIVQKQSDANTVNVTRKVLSRFAKIEEELPRGVKLETVWDQATFINRSMANLGNTALQAMALTFLVLLFFLRNIKSSFIVAVSIPISMVVTFALMNQAGLTLNIISMAGLALAVGLLVDNSIVVLESIFRIHEEGEEPRQAAFRGAKEVSMAITASTLTTISVFVPVLFVPGLAGELFNEMVITLCFSLAVSLIVALTLVPLLASRLLGLRVAIRRHNLLSRISDTIASWLAGLQNNYLIVLRWSLAHRKTVLFSTLGLFIIAILLLTTRGGEFLPQSDMGYIQIAVDRSPGTSLESMEKSVHEMNRIISESVPEAEMVYTNFGQGEGMFAAFSSSGSNEGEIIIRLKNRNQRKRGMFEIQDELREKFKMLPDVQARFEDRGMEIFGTAGDISIEIFGYDLEIAEALANDIEARIKDIKGVVNSEITIREAAPELRIDLDRQRIADLGLSTAQVSQVVSTSVLGTVASRYRDSGDEFDIRVQLEEEARQDKKDLENILLMTPVGKQVPLRAVARVDYDKAPKEILREDQERIVRVDIDISGRDVQSATRDVKKALTRVTIPNDFRIEIGGVAEEQRESFMYLGIAMLVALLLVYMVMASQFESFIDPFIILFTIPLSIIGVALALVITNTTLSVMALIGMIMLVGIVVNNGIVLVDYINQLRERGRGLFEAIYEGGKIRMRPVLMTALTTILAMAPLALGLGESGENWAPMARAVMGGMMVATALTLNVVPVVYTVLELLGEKIKAKLRARREAKLAKYAAERA
jgi:HAE1 family hydrophobic/amphiphilic exporter-1